MWHSTAAWISEPYQQSHGRLAHYTSYSSTYSNLCQQNKSLCRYWGNEQPERIPAAETVDEALLRLIGPVAAAAKAGADCRADGAVMLALAKAACLVVI